MTPLQISKDWCANHQTDGSCMGAVFGRKGNIESLHRKPKCVVGTPGIRCPYFEQCVLPFGVWIENIKYRQEYEEAARQYRLAANVPSTHDRLCICGKALEPRKRLCYVCRAAKRKATISAAVQKHRNQGVV